MSKSLKNTIIEICAMLNAPTVDTFGGVYTDSTNPESEGYDGRVKSEFFNSLSIGMREEINRVKLSFKTDYYKELTNTMHSICHGVILEQYFDIDANGDIYLSDVSTGIDTLEVLNIYSKTTDESVDPLDKNIVKMLYNYEAIPPDDFIEEDDEFVSRIGNRLSFKPLIKNEGESNEWLVSGKTVYVVYVGNFDQSMDDVTNLLTLFSFDFISLAIRRTFDVLNAEGINA